MAESTDHLRGPRILFVEDEDSIADPFSAVLRRAGFDAVRAATVAEAIREFDAAPPDLVLLDLRLPDGDGRDVAREIRKRGEVPIIMLTARGAEADRVIGLELGADDYVVKPFSSAEVIARIRAVLRRAGEGPAGPDRVEFEDLEIDIPAREVALGGEPVSLTRREFDLLALLARRVGEVVTREEIIDKVWDENWFGSTKTLDVHTSSLRKKLGDDPANPRFIHTARGVGLRFGGPVAPVAGAER